MCESEAVETDSGITYFWPATAPGFTANFSCPLNSTILVTRACGNMGWVHFDEEACGDSDQVNNQLDNVFNNVRHISITNLYFSVEMPFPFIQLTTENYATAVLVVSQVIAQSVNDTNEQTSDTLTAVTDYLVDLSLFVENSDVQINETVRLQYMLAHSVLLYSTYT